MLILSTVNAIHVLLYHGTDYRKHNLFATFKSYSLRKSVTVMDEA